MLNKYFRKYEYYTSVRVWACRKRFVCRTLQIQYPESVELRKTFFIFVATIGQIVTYRSVWLCPCWKSGTFQNVGIDNTTLITM